MLLGLSNKQAVILVDNATKREYFVRPKRIKASQLWFASLDRTILACRHLALYGTRLLCPMASYSQNIVTKNMATCTCLSSFCMVLGPRPRWSCVALFILKPTIRTLICQKRRIPTCAGHSSKPYDKKRFLPDTYFVMLLFWYYPL